jgi:hypothetical protein
VTADSVSTRTIGVRNDANSIVSDELCPVHGYSGVGNHALLASKCSIRIRCIAEHPVVDDMRRIRNGVTPKWLGNDAEVADDCSSRM